ncbi:zinc finger protein 567-like [Galleria mellonella]|uniref:Zinc finger protein 567-like n=1 Tax=Galleria mellonella TaxID=7137 RepID=A0A6J3BNE9_GALME|nr:zinc finger protein 567-like [Galleria mellonella]
MSSAMDNIQIRACRVCLNTECPDNISLEAGSAWLRMYEYCFGIPINDNDRSRRLCSHCANNMKKFAKFKRKCLKSHRLWKSLMSEKSKCKKSAMKIEVKLEIIKNRLKKEKDEFYEVPSTDLPEVKDQGNFIENNFVSIQVKNENDSETIYNDDHFDAVSTKNEDDNHFDTVETKNDNDDVNIHNKVKVEKLKVVSKKNNTEKKLKRNFNNTLQCEVCKKIYKHKQSFFKHTQKGTCKPKKKIPDNDLPICPIFYCGICDMTSSESDLISKHIEEHRSLNDLSCKMCEFKGRDFADMVTHRFSHHPKEFKTIYSCHVCGRRSPAPLPLQFHYRSAHLKKNGGMCTVCNKIFRVYKLWRNHERLHKEETNKYICDHCGKECLFRHEIKIHLASHFNIRTFICDTCGKRFKQLRGLKHHMASAHVTNPIKCTHCNKTFKHKFSLESHMKLLGGDKPFKCEVCSKCFSSTWYLKSHMFWHTGERPFPCELCGKRFKAKCQLTVHLRRHMGNLPYKCSHCSKCFTTTTQRRVHESVHTGIRRHKCPYCEKSYHCKKVMRVHCKTHHNIEVDSSDEKRESSEVVDNKVK